MQLAGGPDLEPPPAELPPPTTPQQYRVQFTANEEYARLVERAKALAASQATDQSLAELHVKAMRLLVESLEKQQFAATDRPRESSKPRQRGSRHIPAAVRRAVFERDCARCTYVDERGVRCHEVANLQLHHRDAFGMGGEHTADNLTLHCRAHNEMAAERDFGCEHIAASKDRARRASLRSQQACIREPSSP